MRRNATGTNLPTVPPAKGTLRRPAAPPPRPPGRLWELWAAPWPTIPPMPTKKKGKQVMVAFRVDAHLAEELDRLPDKSAFIRGAIERAFHVACPVCEGRGTVSHDTAHFVDALLRAEKALRCPCCGAVMPAPRKGGRPAPSAPAITPPPLPLADTACGHCGDDGHGH